MKYIDVEKLKTELSRQKHELELSIQSQGDYGQSCHIVAYENIISIINSLQKEQPEVELEKEFEDYLGNMEGQPRMWHPDEQIEWAKDIARHFYELSKNSK